MGKKRRPPTAKSNVVNPPSQPPSNRSPYDTNGGPTLNASMNGISLPPAIANQILAAMSRSSGGPNMPANAANTNAGNTAFSGNDGMSKQYLDEMGRMIAAHMNNAVASGAFGGSVRFSGAPPQHPAQPAQEGKAVFGPAPPPQASVEFGNQWSAGEYECFVKGAKKSGNAPNVPIDATNFQNIQQLFNMAAAAAGTSSAAGGTFSFTTGKINGKAAKSHGNNPEDVKTMMNLFGELMGMPNSGVPPAAASAAAAGNGPSNEELAREFYEKFIASDLAKQQQQMLQGTDPLALRKAAFAAGVNVAMQQQMMREESEGKGKGAKGGASNGGGAGAAGNNSNMPVFSMIFGNNGEGQQPQQPQQQGAIPTIPPPPNGWPTGGPSAAAAAAAAAFASTLNMSKEGEASLPPQYCSAEFNAAFSSPELGSPAWLEYYFEEYARNARNGGAPQDRPDLPAGQYGIPTNQESSAPTAKVDCPARFEYGEDYEEEEERLMDERRTILRAEEEERKAKAASKKRDKKARKKERAKKEAEAKAALAAKKKREKAITSWRSRIVAACASSDASKMDVLLSESPYKNYVYDPDEYDLDEEDDEGYIPQSQEEYLIRQLDWFLPNVLQKYPELELGKVPFERNEARERLAKYIMSQSFDAVCIPGPNMLRNALHTAAYKNDENFVKWIIEGQKEALARQKEIYCECDGSLEHPYGDCLDALCDDMGWTPLHYATAAGSEGVVELLLAAGCHIRARSDYELTCLNSTGYGVTARELATVLQSGAIHEDLSCDGDVLDEIIETRIVCASTNEKNAYMRLLRSLTERLEDVEINGYSPLQKPDEQNKSTSKTIPSKVEGQAPAATSKKAKKKKKKQQQQANSSTPASNLSNEPEKKIEPKPAPVNAPEEDLTDPVAVALLGMGFTADQIVSAAKALGGFERATADDMVMWILSGGELVDEEQDNSTEDNASAEYDESNNSEAIAKTEKKAAAKAKREAEELARKRQEELAAAERAAAKREEQRRIRREWNEREQARQEVEKNAKIAQVVEQKKQAELQKLQEEMASKKSPPVPATVNAGGGKGKSKSGQGPPQTIVAGPGHGGKKSGGVSTMGIPKGPHVKAPKILARPNNVPPVTSTQPNTQPVASNQPLFPPGQAPANVLPAGTKPYSNQPAPMPKSRNSSQPRHAHPPAQSSSYGPRVVPSMGNNNFYNPNSGSSSFGYDSAYGNDAGSMPLISGGSKYYSNPVQHGGSSIPPPGFKPAVPPPPVTTDDSSHHSGSNPLGEIRATAREFVPTSFAPVREATPSGEFNAVPSMSSQPATVSHPHQPTRTSSADVSSLLDPMSSLLGSLGNDTNNLPGAMPAPVTKSDSPVQSATSSITGFSGMAEEATTSRVGSALTFESAVGGLQTSSILESISYSGGHDSGIPGLGSGGIWGDNTTNQSSNLGGLVGLNFSAFLNVDPNKNNGQSSNNNNTWGTGTGGSIW